MPTPKPTFSLDDWKMRWARNASEAEANSHMDSGWSKATADRCEGQTRTLLLELTQALAATPTTPADLFDRPDLVQCQEAARFALGR